MTTPLTWTTSDDEHWRSTPDAPDDFLIVAVRYVRYEIYREGKRGWEPLESTTSLDAAKQLAECRRPRSSETAPSHEKGMPT